MTLKVVVAGVTGRMGQTIAKLIIEDERFEFVGGTEKDGHPQIGEDIGLLTGSKATGVQVSSQLEPLFAMADVVIDFTIPEATVHHARLAAQARIAHVIGTTGFTLEQEDEIKWASHHSSIVKSGNMSLGVNLVAALTKRVAAALSNAFDIEIVEMHHKHKIDAPSGTALMLAQAASQGRGVNLEDVRIPAREGITGSRPNGGIGMSAIRGGSVVGDHDVLFASDEEMITISHRAQDRSLFARGALTAAIWAAHQPPGLYSMIDVLGLDT